MKKSNFPDIFGYTNYRTFLNDCFKSKKKENTKYTYREYSKEAGLSSPSALKEVIDGKKGIAAKSIEKFIAPFGLSKNQTLFFKNLVLFNQSKKESVKNTFFAEMIRLQCLPQTKTITASQYQFYSNWFNSVIREIIVTKDFKEDPEWIAKRIIPHITQSQAKKALALLVKLKLIKRDASGNLVQDAAHLKVDPDVSSLSIRNFNRSMIDMGKEAIERFDSQDREVSGSTIATTREGYKKIKEMVRKFKQELAAFNLSDADEPELVCQMNFQLFPVTGNK